MPYKYLNMSLHSLSHFHITGIVSNERDIHRKSRVCEFSPGLPQGSPKRHQPKPRSQAQGQIIRRGEGRR